jgi:hypothetical protein
MLDAMLKKRNAFLKPNGTNFETEEADNKRRTGNAKGSGDKQVG